MGLSRDMLYRNQNAVAEGEGEALFEANSKKLNYRNLVEDATEIGGLPYTIGQPAHCQTRVSNDYPADGASAGIQIEPLLFINWFGQEDRLDQRAQLSDSRCKALRY